MSFTKLTSSFKSTKFSSFAEKETQKANFSSVTNPELLNPKECVKKLDVFFANIDKIKDLNAAFTQNKELRTKYGLQNLLFVNPTSEHISPLEYGVAKLKIFKDELKDEFKKDSILRPKYYWEENNERIGGLINAIAKEAVAAINKAEIESREVGGKKCDSDGPLDSFAKAVTELQKETSLIFNQSKLYSSLG